MTGCDHETSEHLAHASYWLAEHMEDQRALDECRQRFGLTSALLGEVWADANKIAQEWDIQ